MIKRCADNHGRLKSIKQPAKNTQPNGCYLCKLFVNTMIDRTASINLFHYPTIEVKRISRNDFHLVKISYI